MIEYLHIQVKPDLEKEECVLDFVRKSVSPEITSENIELYEEDLEGLLEKFVKVGMKVREDENHKSLVAIVAYSYRRDAPPDDWFIAYFNTHQDYMPNQADNYIAMKKDFDLHRENAFNGE